MGRERPSRAKNNDKRVQEYKEHVDLNQAKEVWFEAIGETGKLLKITRTKGGNKKSLLLGMLKQPETRSFMDSKLECVDKTKGLYKAKAS